MFFEIAIALIFLIGMALIVRGYSEVKYEKAQSVALKITRRLQRSEVEDILTDHEREFAMREEARAANERRAAMPVVNKLVNRNALFARLDEDLFQARSDMRAAELLSISVVLGLVVFIVTYYLGFGLLSVLFGFLCLLMPWGYVKRMRAKYYHSFEEQLTDTLLLMANGLRAGFSFLQTMEMISRESPPPMSDEFSRVIQEVSVGVTINDALQNLADRVNSMDLNLMVTAVAIQREIGGGLAEILETIANVIGERMRIKREVKVLTTQGRLSGAILAALPISIGLLIHITTKMGSPGTPSFIEPLLYDSRGQMMLVLAGINQIVGFFFIMRIVSIRV